MDIYLSVNCAECDEEIYNLVRTYIEHNGKPVLSVDMGAQQSFYCDDCNKNTYTMEMETIGEDEL